MRSALAAAAVLTALAACTVTTRTEEEEAFLDSWLIENMETVDEDQALALGKKVCAALDAGRTPEEAQQLLLRDGEESVIVHIVFSSAVGTLCPEYERYRDRFYFGS